MMAHCKVLLSADQMVRPQLREGMGMVSIHTESMFPGLTTV